MKILLDLLLAVAIGAGFTVAIEFILVFTVGIGFRHAGSLMNLAACVLAFVALRRRRLKALDRTLDETRQLP